MMAFMNAGPVALFCPEVCAAAATGATVTQGHGLRGELSPGAALRRVSGVRRRTGVTLLADGTRGMLERTAVYFSRALTMKYA
jgi:hypothetical protein